MVTDSIPNNLVTVRPWDKPWYCNELRKQKTKLEYTKVAKKRNTMNDWEKFRQLRNSYVKNCRSAEQNYLSSLKNKLHDPNVVYSRKW